LLLVANEWQLRVQLVAIADQGQDGTVKKVI
jgi:hypothetical protein